jgi:hypothetical protein
MCGVVMGALIDKKQNLARGFADLHTPSEVENELVYSWQEKKQDLIKRIEDLSALIDKEQNASRKKTLENCRTDTRKRLADLGQKIQKRVNLNLLIIDRLKQFCDEDIFKQACALARQDKARILSQFSMNELDI